MLDQIVSWNNVLLDTFRAHNGQPGSTPGPRARHGAMMHLAMYDAVNLIEGSPHKPFLPNLGSVIVPAGASKDAAAAYAANHLLKAINEVYKTVPGYTAYAALKALYQTAITTFEALFPGSAASRQAGKQVGEAVADLMLADRAADVLTDFVDWNQSMPAAGHWRPTHPGLINPISGKPLVLSPHWGNFRPFALPSNWQTTTNLRPPLPGGFPTRQTLLTSPEYAWQVNEVKRLGGRVGSERTLEQTQIAYFWSIDSGETPAYGIHGQLFRMAQVASAKRGLNFSDNARLFAITAIALIDALIVAIDSKYHATLDLWRPESAIRLAHLDGNPATMADPDWEPLSYLTRDIRAALPTPAYISGHTLLGAAAARVMRNFFGTDHIRFEMTSDDPHAVDEFGAKLIRRFQSFSQAAEENGRSRTYLGVHYPWDVDEGLTAGARLGDLISAARA